MCSILIHMFLVVLTCSLLAKGAQLKETRSVMCIVQASMKSYLIFIHTLWPLIFFHFYVDKYVYTHIYIMYQYVYIWTDLINSDIC